MKKINLKKAFIFTLVGMSLAVCSINAFAGTENTDFVDVIDGHWATNAIQRWTDYGIVKGEDHQLADLTPIKIFKPSSSITRGEIAVMLDRIMNYQSVAENKFSDLDEKFYTEAILKANAAGILQGDTAGTVRPKDSVTRQEAIVLLARAFGIEESAVANSLLIDSASISEWARNSVFGMINEGYVSGRPLVYEAYTEYEFAPTANITRAEFVTILDKMVSEIYSEPGTYTKDTKGIVVVNVSDVVLKDMKIDGDLIVTEGVGEGDLTLDNVTIGGRMIVRGGGQNSVAIKRNSKVGKIILENANGAIRVKTEEGAKVDLVVVDRDSKDIILEGEFNSIEVLCKEITVTGENLVAAIVTMRADSTILNLGAASKVNNVVVDGDNAILKGTAENVNVIKASAQLNFVGANVSKVTVEANNAEVNIDKESSVENIDVKSNNATVDAEKGAEVKNVEVSGKDINVDVNSNTKINVTTGGSVSTGNGNTTNGGGSARKSVVTLKFDYDETDLTITKTTSNLAGNATATTQIIITDENDDRVSAFVAGNLTSATVNALLDEIADYDALLIAITNKINDLDTLKSLYKQLITNMSDDEILTIADAVLGIPGMSARLGVEKTRAAANGYIDSAATKEAFIRLYDAIKANEEPTTETLIRDTLGYMTDAELVSLFLNVVNAL